MNEMILFYEKPFISFSTNDAHLFCLSKKDSLQENIFCLNALDMGYSITKTKYGLIYDCYLRIKQENVINHIEIEKETMGGVVGFSEFLLKVLSEKKYLILDLDVSKINNYECDGSVAIHSPLVIGINMKEQKILLGDFFDFKHYDVQWATLQEVYEGYRIIGEYITNFSRDGDDEWIRKTSLIQPDDTKLKYNIREIINNIQEYLEPPIIEFTSKQISSFHLVSNRIQRIQDATEITELLEVGSGINIYNYLRNHIKAEFEQGEYRIVQSASLLVSHFKILRKSLLFLNENNHLNFAFLNSVDKMIKYSSYLEVCFLKNYVKRLSNNNIEEYLHLIDLIESSERTFLNEVLTILNEYSEV